LPFANTSRQIGVYRDLHPARSKTMPDIQKRGCQSFETAPSFYFIKTESETEYFNHPPYFINSLFYQV
jgi:hypothetical protein